MEAICHGEPALGARVASPNSRWSSAREQRGADRGDRLVQLFDHVPQPIVQQPNHIRAIYDGRWKYARYFDPAGEGESQYELYDHQTDPDELVNLAGENAAKEAEMAGKLAALEASRLAPAQLHKGYLPLIRG